MPAPTNAVVTEIEPGVLAGPIRNVINPDIQAGEGSIHDQATAQRLGFRGGTVAGSYHMNLFPPLALAAWGRQWFERGSLSLYFRNATTDREPVQAFMNKPSGKGNEQVDCWIKRQDGMLVAEGSIAAGDPGEIPALQRIDLAEIDPSGCRILSEIHVGDPIPETGMIMGGPDQERRLNAAAELLDWNLGESPWGKPVLVPNSMVGLLYQPAVATIRKKVRRSVGLFGAIELRTINGPTLAETPYTVHGKVIAVGQSPKTEFYWYETFADDQDGKRVCEMRMLLRFMKASSPLWAEGS
jgi:hypothetical protein